MILKGIIPISTKVSPSGQPTHRFRTPYSTKIVSTKNFRAYLKSINKTTVDMILEINELSRSDLPRCKVCKSNHVRISGHNENNLTRIDLVNPVIGDTCSEVDCIRSFRATKSNRTAASNGNHPTQTGSIVTRSYPYEYNGKLYKFDSVTSRNVFRRYRRFLSKFYLREKKVSEYELNGQFKYYIADYVLRSEYRGRGLPDVIEVKGGTVFEFRGRDESEMNYLKFKSIVTSGRSILLIDGVYGVNRKLTLFKTEDELKSFFKLPK